MSEQITMNEWASRIHGWAVGKGWWSRPTDTIPAKLLLIHSEISEAAECLRDARPCPKGAPDFDYDDLRDLKRWEGKPVGFALEIADTIIRCLDLCAQVGIDIDEVVRQKMEYNASREHRHGGRGF